jgi:site-specific DNA-cytosine methylase
VQVHPVNFADYGAPQLRERILIIGVRNDIKKDFVMPARTHDKRSHVGAKEALKDVEHAVYNNEHQKINEKTKEKLPEEERKLIPEQTAMYHKYHELIREGEYYRILSSRENHRSDCWAVASEDKSEVLVTYVQVLAQANMPSRKVRLRGFDPAKKYRLEGTDEVYSGEMLMNAGFRMKDFWGDFVSRLYHFVAVD